MDLEGQHLELLNGGVRSDDVEEALIVRHEARCLDLLVANDGPSAPVRLKASNFLVDSHRSNSLVGYICSRRSVEYRAIEGSRDHSQTRILVRYPRPTTAVEARRYAIQLAQRRACKREKNKPVKHCRVSKKSVLMEIKALPNRLDPGIATYSTSTGVVRLLRTCPVDDILSWEHPRSVKDAFTPV